MLNSIFTKILFATVVLVIIIALFMALANSILYQNTLKNEINTKAIEILNELAESKELQKSLLQHDESKLLDIISEKAAQELTLFLVVYDLEKKLIHSGFFSLLPEASVKDPFLYKIKKPLKKISKNQGRHYLDLSIPVRLSQDLTKMKSKDMLFEEEQSEDLLFGEPSADVTPKTDSKIESEKEEQIIGYLRIGLSMEEVDEKISNNNQLNWILALVALGIGIIFSITVSLSITSPIKKLRNATEIIAGGDFDYTIPIKSKDEIGELASSFNRMTRELKIIGDLTDELNKQPNIRALAKTLLWFIVGVLDFDRTFLFVKDNERFEFVGATGKWSKDKTDQLKRFKGEWLSDDWETTSFIEGILASVAQEQQTFDLSKGTETETEGYMSRLAQEGLSFIGRPSCIIPIVVKQETIGILCISNGDSKTPFTDEQRRLLNSVVRESGSAIINTQHKSTLIEQERLKSELDIATKIQTSLLPPLPEIEGYEISADMIPAEEVGGDYYDFIHGKDNNFWLGIGDVTSHGLTPGLIMMMAQSTLNGIITENPEISPKKVVGYLNKVLYGNIRQRLGVEEHMTISVLSANGNGSFRYAGAHEDILIYRNKTRKCERIETKGFWVGILPDINNMVFEDELHLEENDVMVLYTDGIIEAKNKKEEQFDVERLIETINDSAHLNAPGIKQAILNSVNEWMDYQYDDITLVVIKKKEI